MPMIKRILLAAALLLPVAAHAQSVTTAAAPPTMYPAFIVNNWYVGKGTAPQVAAAATGGNLIACSFGGIDQNITIGTLAIQSTTTDSGKKLQLAVYSTGSWGRPATLIAATGDLTMGGTNAVLSGAASGKLPVGPYWFCLNTESTTAVFRSQAIAATANSSTQATVGSATVANAIEAAAQIAGVSIAQTYGTWPSSFASNAAWGDIVTAISPVIGFQVSSVP